MMYATLRPGSVLLSRHHAVKIRKILMDTNPWMRVVREVIPWSHADVDSRQYRLLIFDTELPAGKTFYGYFAGGDPEKPLGRRKKA